MSATDEAKAREYAERDNMLGRARVQDNDELTAHYDELEWAAEHDVSKNLIRFSIGLEPCDHLLAILQEAFTEIGY